MSKPKGVSPRETVSRVLQSAGLRVAGARGARVANRVSEAIGCGRIHLCDRPHCEDCAPLQPVKD